MSLLGSMLCMDALLWTEVTDGITDGKFSTGMAQSSVSAWERVAELLDLILMRPNQTGLYKTK